jgi:hypothetical protein
MPGACQKAGVDLVEIAKGQIRRLSKSLIMVNLNLKNRRKIKKAKSIKNYSN